MHLKTSENQYPMPMLLKAMMAKTRSDIKEMTTVIFKYRFHQRYPAMTFAVQ